MAEKGQIEVDGPNREELGGIVDSIAGHPDLQVKQDEHGNVVPTDEWTAKAITNFYDGVQPNPGAEPAKQTDVAGDTTTPQKESAASQSDTTQNRTEPDRPTPTRSAADLEREIHELKSKIRERNDENIAIKAAQQTAEMLAQTLRPVPQPEGPRRVPIAFDERNQPYASYDEIEKLAGDRIARMIDERVRQSLQPITQASEAYSRMKRDFPDFSRDEARFSQWLESNPTYRDRIAQDPDGGMEAAYLRYHYDAGQARSAETTQSAVAAQQAVASVQKHAAPAGGAATSNRRTTETEAREQQLKALRKHAEETGDWRPYSKARLADAIGESYLNTLTNTSWGR